MGVATKILFCDFESILAQCLLCNLIFRFSLGPHCAYFCMQKLKPQVAKTSTVASVMRDQ